MTGDWRLVKVAVGQAKAGNEVLMSYVDWRVTSNVIGCSRRRRGGGGHSELPSNLANMPRTVVGGGERGKCAAPERLL